jgi:hypothetical protein
VAARLTELCGEPVGDWLDESPPPGDLIEPASAVEAKLDNKTVCCGVDEAGR